MSEQALDLRRSVQIVRRHKVLVTVVATLGLLAGAGYAVLSPPMFASNALVTLPLSTHDTETQVVIASSDHVLASALRNLGSAMSLQTMHSRVQVKSLTSNLLSISAQGKTAAQAESTANAVANSYVSYIGTAESAAGPVQAKLLQPAVTATGTPLPIHLLVFGGLGALLGALIGVIIALAISRGDRRLRERDEIANAIGVPVLASMPVLHPSDAAGWARLLESYEPGVVQAWQLQTALRQLGQTNFVSAQISNGDSASVSDGDRFSVAILSLSSDRKALALGPQLAVFAASLGIPTALVIAAGQDANATAMLRAACAAAPSAPSRRPSHLRFAVSGHGHVDGRPDAALTVVVAVVDGRTPQVADTMRTSATVLGVSAGTATAVQLARIAVSGAADGRQIDGIFVADPDPADHTTGRVPQLARSARRRMPTRLTGITTEIRR